MIILLIISIIGMIVSAVFVVAACMRSSQISRLEEERWRQEALYGNDYLFFKGDEDND